MNPEDPVDKEIEKAILDLPLFEPVSNSNDSTNVNENSDEAMDKKPQERKSFDPFGEQHEREKREREEQNRRAELAERRNRRFKGENDADNGGKEESAKISSGPHKRIREGDEPQENAPQQVQEDSTNAIPKSLDENHARKRRIYHDGPVNQEIENQAALDLKFEDGIHCLDWYDSDLSLMIDEQTMMVGKPLNGSAWSYVWSGARSTYGFDIGKVYYEVKILDERKNLMKPDETDRKTGSLKELRVGWSTNDTDLILGRESTSFAYSSRGGKKWRQAKGVNYGQSFGKGDVIGSYLDIKGDYLSIRFTKNGEDQDVAYEIHNSELRGMALFPHVSSKNFIFEVNFGYDIVTEISSIDATWQQCGKMSIMLGKAKESWCEPLPSYIVVGNAICVKNLPIIESREDCEMLTLIGLPGSGKTTWASKNAKALPEKRINVIGAPQLLDRTDVDGKSIIEHFLKCQGDQPKVRGNGNFKLSKFTSDDRRRCIDEWIDIAAKRNRNVTIDICPQSYDKEYRWIKQFEGMIRKAIVIVPSDDSYKFRVEKQKQEDDLIDLRISKSRKWIDNLISERKSTFTLPPEDGDSPFNTISYVELQKNEAASLVEKYNKEGKEKERLRKVNKNREITKNNEGNRRRSLGFGERFRNIPKNNEVNRRNSLGFVEGFRNVPYTPAFNGLAWQQQQMLAAMEKQQQILKEQQMLAVMEERKRTRLGFTSSTANQLPSTSKYYTSSGLGASNPMFGGSFMQGMGQGNRFNFGPGIIDARLAGAVG